MLGFFGVLICAAVGVSDVGDDVVRLFEHPVVAPGNGVVWVDRLDSLREHRVGVVIVFCLLTGHIGQHDGVVDLRVFSLARCEHRHQIGLDDPHRTYPHRGWLSDPQAHLLTSV